MLIRPPQFHQPEAGEAGSAEFTITLEPPPLDGCVSLAMHRATLLISRSLLEQLKRAGTASGTTRPERKDLLRGGRAQLLLSALSETSDEFGCLRSQPDESDYVYLVAELLNAGQLSVVDTATKRPVETVQARYSAFMAGPTAGAGHMFYSYRLPGDPTVSVQPVHLYRSTKGRQSPSFLRRAEHGGASGRSVLAKAPGKMGAKWLDAGSVLRTTRTPS